MLDEDESDLAIHLRLGDMGTGAGEDGQNQYGLIACDHGRDAHGKLACERQSLSAKDAYATATAGGSAVPHKEFRKLKRSDLSLGDRRLNFSVTSSDSPL